MDTTGLNPHPQGGSSKDVTGMGPNIKSQIHQGEVIYDVSGMGSLPQD